MEKVKNKAKNKVKSTTMQVVDSLVEPMALGDVFVKSGMFKDVKSQAEAVVKILAGRELGLAPLESMTNIYMINGKIALPAKIIGSLIKRSNRYDYIVEKLNEQECEIVFYRLEKDDKKIEIGKSNFTIKDAAKAGIVNKEVWKAYPRNLLFARALTNGAKWFCADVCSGFTPEELEDGISNEAEKETVTIKNGKVEKINNIDNDSNHNKNDKRKVVKNGS